MKGNVTNRKSTMFFYVAQFKCRSLSLTPAQPGALNARFNLSIRASEGNGRGERVAFPWLHHASIARAHLILQAPFI